MNVLQENCESKTRFVTIGAARSVIKGIRRRKPDVRFFAYYCNICRGYHLSTSGKR